MSLDAPNQDLLNEWKAGNHDAAATIFRRYQVRVLALVRSRLSRKLARRLDPEDIMLSAYRSFFVSVQRGRLTSGDSDDLWPILTTITLRKLARQARRHSAERRSVDQEETNDTTTIETLIGREPTAEDAAILANEIELLMNQLDETAREVLVRTLQGQDVVSIAAELSIHERTVRRAIERVRGMLPVTPDDLQLRGQLLSNLTSKLHGFLGSMERKLLANRQRRLSMSVPKAIAKLPHATISAVGTAKYNNYLLTRFIGAGAFSKVYCATERPTGKTVAIKYLRKDCWGDPRATQALIREYELLRELQHHLILRIHGWGTTPGGATFLVTDFIQGKNLEQWSRIVRPSVKQIVEVVRAVASAVASAHLHDIVHGDLKPANILMRDDGQIVLCDFGLSRYASAPDDVPLGGTAGFLAPEQITDAFGPISLQTDIYGLGALLYALLTERPPMRGRDLPEVLGNVISQKNPDPPSLECTSISKELDALVLRCLAKEPQERFRSVQEFLLALANLNDL